MSETTYPWDQHTEVTSTTILKQVSDMCQEYKKLGERIEKGEALLEELKKKQASISEITIPDMLSSAGLEEIKLISGEKVSVKKMYTANIKKEDWDAAKKYLKDNDDDAIIKTLVAVQFGKGKQEMINSIKLMKHLNEEDVPFKAKEEIHWQTLRSYVTGKMESSESFPMDIFGVYTINKTTIK